jgi:hypothetical protein
MFLSHTKNMCILIRLAWNHFLKHATHHRSVYALVLFSLFLCLRGYNPRTCFWFHETVYSLVLHLLYHGDLSTMGLTFCVHDFVMQVLQHYLYSVFMLSHLCNSSNLMLFINFHQYIRLLTSQKSHKTLLNPHVLNHSLKLINLIKYNFNILKALKTIHTHILY